MGAATRKLADLQRLYENTQIYCQKLSTASQLLCTKVAELRQMWCDITSGTTLALLHEADQSICRVSDEWDLVQHQDIEFEILPMMAHLSRFLVAQKKCVAKIEHIIVARKILYDPMCMQNFVNQAKRLFGSKNAKLFDEIVVDQKIDLNILLNCFASILPHIVTELYLMKPLNVSSLSVRANLLLALSKKLNGILMRLNSTECEYDNHCRPNPIEYVNAMRSVAQFSNLTARIKSTLINTPPIAEAKLKQPTTSKRPRIFCIDLIEAPPSVEYYAVSSVCENATDLQPAPKIFRHCDSTLDTLKAIEMLKNIQMQKGVEPLKSSRRLMLPKSVTTLDCQTIQVKALETLQQTPRVLHTIDKSDGFLMEKEKGRTARNRNRISLDGT